MSTVGKITIGHQNVVKGYEVVEGDDTERVSLIHPVFCASEVTSQLDDLLFLNDGDSIGRQSKCSREGIP